MLHVCVLDWHFDCICDRVILASVYGSLFCLSEHKKIGLYPAIFSHDCMLISHNCERNEVRIVGYKLPILNCFVAVDLCLRIVRYKQIIKNILIQF